MKLIAETQEPCKASGHPVKVKWYLADADDLPEEVRKAVTGETGSDTVTG